MPLPAVGEARAKVLRTEIAALVGITGSSAENALAEKRAELLAIQLARREAKPLDTRAKDIEKVVEGKRKAVDKQQQHVVDLKAKIVQLQEDLTAAQAKDLQLKEELAKVEAEKVDILRRVAEEAAVEANVGSLQPKVLLQGLATLEQLLQPAHCQLSGLSVEQFKVVLGVFNTVLQGQVLAPVAAAAGSSGAAPALPPLQQEQQQSQQLPAQTGAAPVLQPGGPQTAGVAPPGRNSDTDLKMEEKEFKELLELGASPE